MKKQITIQRGWCGSFAKPISFIDEDLIHAMEGETIDHRYIPSHITNVEYLESTLTDKQISAINDLLRVAYTLGGNDAYNYTCDF